MIIQDSEFMSCDAESTALCIDIARKLGVKKLFLLARDSRIHTMAPSSSDMQVIALDSKRVLDASAKDLRALIEGSKDSYIWNLETYLTQQKGRINQVICNLASSRRMTFLFSLSMLTQSDRRIRSRLMRKMRDCIKLFRKYDVSYYLSGLSDDPYDMRQQSEKESFVISLMRSKRPFVPVRDPPFSRQ